MLSGQFYGAYLVNETAAKEFGWKQPLGKSIWGPLGTDRDEGKVIGVVQDFHFASLHNKIEPLIIFLVNEDWGIGYVYVKLQPLAAPGLITQIENEYKSIFAHLPFEWEYLDSKFMSLYSSDRQVRDVFQIGLWISVFLSAMAIFSISALLLITRSKEMGIRKIVGASQFELFRHHMKAFVKFIVVAVLVAWPSIYYLSNRWLDNFAYHIDLDLSYFIVPAIITILILTVTSGVHGIKNARINPVEILKEE